MSPTRQRMGSTTPDGKIWVRSFAVGFSAGMHLGDHAHTWHQLSYASEGTLRVSAADSVWLVPPQRALWLPAGVRHSEEMRARGTLRNLYFARAVCRAMPRECAVLALTPLLRELIVHAAEHGPLDGSVAAQRDLIRVLLQQLATQPHLAAHRLPMPKDTRALWIAQTLCAQPGTDADLSHWAGRVGASVRTIQRLFLGETGMSFREWRQKARLISALERLGAGKSVTDVALDVGYSSLSAFVSCFRGEFGCSPGRMRRA